ncbi:hypothetical protein [Euzebya rosea]|uniref:hypothetical protein n=1 Tax=Euzebya rosea TaxID=2052804 RepID=UPI000D3ED77A|nr:hypothetical protein [Euzebya rosea]
MTHHLQILDPAVDGVAELLDGARAALLVLSLDTCGHITDSASACVACPADGLRCTPCAKLHYADDHELGWRFTCDRCGTVDHQLSSVMCAGVTALLTGHPLPVDVRLDGLGLCAACCLHVSGTAGGVG